MIAFAVGILLGAIIVIAVVIYASNRPTFPW